MYSPDLTTPMILSWMAVSIASFWRRGANSGIEVVIERTVPSKGWIQKPFQFKLRAMSETAMKTIHIKTFGCQMNVYDSERMLALLENQGFKLEPELSRADVILINTCSIRDKAE